ARRRCSRCCGRRCRQRLRPAARSANVGRAGGERLAMIRSDGFFRAKELEAYEAMGSLDEHAETVRLILAEASLLAEKYRYVARHDVPHVREIAGLIDLLWQGVGVEGVATPEAHPAAEIGTS